MHILRSSLKVTGAAATARILGFVRDILLAAVMGAGPAADALILALRLPNILRRTVGEGGLNAAVVPIYARMKAQFGALSAGRSFGAVATLVAGATLAALAALEVAAPALVGLFAPGLPGPERLTATANLRIALPGAAAIVIAALLGARLNAERRIRIAVAAPLLINLVTGLVLVLLLAMPQPLPRAGTIVAGAYTAAALAQLLAAIADSRTLPAGGFAWPRPGDRIGRLAGRIGPAVLAAGSVELIFLAATAAASFLPSGVSRLYYAERLAQLPLGFIGASAGIVLLPAIAARLADGRAAEIGGLCNRALSAALGLALPAAAALVVLAHPIIAVLFERGAFGAADVAAAAEILAGLAFALPAVAVGKIMAQAAFALERLAAALVATGVAVIVTLLAALALAPLLGPLALGLCVAAGLWSHAALLAAVVVRAGLWRPDRRLLLDVARFAGAAALMALAVGIAGRMADVATMAPAMRWLWLGAVCCGGGLAYLVLVLAFGALDRRELLAQLRSE